jgi:hypothetical protein
MRRPGTIWPFLTTGFSIAAPTDRIRAWGGLTMASKL